MTPRTAVFPPVLCALLAAALAAAGCGGPSGPEEPADVVVPAGTPVVLISVDTLRSDRLPAYGYDDVETPHLDAFRSDAILFEHAYSPAPTTLPAHASIFTGLLPPEHGVRDNAGYRLDAPSLPSLAATLRDRDYRTGAAVSAFVLRGSTGVDHGFEVFEDRIAQRSWSVRGSAQRTGDRTLVASRPWLRSVADEPFFFFFHLYEPHQPLEPPEPFASRYPSAYDGEVASADAIVGDLLDELRSLGVYDRALILFVSDHGEGLGDHGFQEHGPLLYREQLQVPLMLKLPGGERAGETVTEPAQLVDILPTVLGLLGIEAPENLPGRSLLALEGAEPRRLFGETLFPRIHFGWSELASVIDYPYHYIHGPDPELYDLERDPGETVDLVAERPRIAGGLRRAARSYDLEYRAPGEEDPEVRAELAALGYLGGGAVGRQGPLPDPKSKLHVLRAHEKAYREFEDGHYGEAIPEFREILAEEPGLAETWGFLGHALLRIGRPAEALEAYRHQMELVGGPQVAHSMAEALFALGRLDEAREHAMAALETYPLHAGDLLAQIALRGGHLERAEKYVEVAVANRGKMPGPLLTQAELRLAQGRFDEVLKITHQVEREAREGVAGELTRGLYFLRGRALVEAGRPDEAVEAFSREIDRFPDSLAVYSHLALLHSLRGDGSRAVATLRRMVEVNDSPEAYAEAVRTIRVLGDPGAASRLLEQARRRWPEAPELRELAG